MSATGDPLGAVRAAFRPGHRQRVPGLAPIPLEDWLRPDPDEGERLAERDALVARHGNEVVGIAKGGGAALAAFGATLRAALPGVPGYRVGPQAVTRPDGVKLACDIDLLSRATADDWLLLVPNAGQAGFRLVAGSACYPAHWRLRDKLGQPLDAVHGPVPGYQNAVAGRVNRIFANLRPDAPLERFNWGIAADSTRHTPPGVTPAIAPGGPWLRVERQTLLRPGEAETVIFSVRTSLAPLATLDAALRGDVRAALGRMDAPMRSYKFRDDVLAAAWEVLGR